MLAGSLAGDIRDDQRRVDRDAGKILCALESINDVIHS